MLGSPKVKNAWFRNKKAKDKDSFSFNIISSRRFLHQNIDTNKLKSLKVAQSKDDNYGCKDDDIYAW